MAGLRIPALFELYSNGQYSDFTVTCKDQQFKTHRNILCPESQFFSAVCKGNFQEQDGVELQEESPQIVARVIHYLYLGDYHTVDEPCTLESHSRAGRLIQPDLTPLEAEKSISFTPKGIFSNTEATKQDLELLEIHCDVYRCADKLGIEPLRYLAAQKFSEILVSLKDVDCFTKAIEMAYENSTPEDQILRAITTELCALNYCVVSQNAEIASVIVKHEPAAWRVACKVATAYEHQQKKIMKALVSATIRHGDLDCDECHLFTMSKDVEIVQGQDQSWEVYATCSTENCDGMESFTTGPI